MLASISWADFTQRKDFGFVTPEAGGEELFVHRSTLDQAGLSELQEGTRVRIQVTDGKKGPQVSTIALASGELSRAYAHGGEPNRLFRR